MLDRQRTIVQSTEPSLQEDGETIARVFYRHLREEHPELASMFNARDQSGWKPGERSRGGICQQYRWFAYVGKHYEHRPHILPGES